MSNATTEQHDQAPGPLGLRFTVNSRPITLTVEPATPLLWVLREQLGLVGTKYSCGSGLCGACSVLVDGQLVRSCVTPVHEVQGKEITTIEGIDPRQSPVMAAWIAENVAQCGYCQPGQVIAATALLQRNPDPSDAEIDRAMAGNLCRCGTYQRIRQAVHRAAAAVRES